MNSRLQRLCMKSSRLIADEIWVMLHEFELVAKVAETFRKNAFGGPRYDWWKIERIGMSMSHLVQPHEETPSPSTCTRTWPRCTIH